MRKARALLSIHLSGNQDVIYKSETKEWLVDRIKCRPNEDIQRFQQIRDKILAMTKDQQNTILDAIRSKITKDNDMTLKV